MKILLLRQNIVPSVYYEKGKTSKWADHKATHRIHVGDRTSMIKLMKLLNVRYNYIKKQKDHSWFDNNYFYTPITNYRENNYKGQVYNLEVPETHSFTTNSLLVHNCGDVMKLFIKVKNNKIIDAKFKTFGCVAAISNSDVLCDLVIGKTIEQAKKITDKDIIKVLGKMPEIKYHCSILGAQTLRKAIENYEKKKL